MILDNLKLTVDRNKDKNKLYLRNLLKEELQYYVLNYVYNSVYGPKFLFKGGTALRFCLDLPRVSEDLDFDVFDYENFNHSDFAGDLKDYFSKRLGFDDLNISISGKNKIIYLKFFVLDKIGFPLEKGKSSDKNLFLRIDLAPVMGEFYKQEVSLKSAYDFSFIIKRYSFEDILSGKIFAVLSRWRFQGKNIEPRFKGRDYFDIFWLSGKGIKPNLKYLYSLVGFKDKKLLKSKIQEKIDQALKKKEMIRDDLIPFFQERKFVDDFIENFESFGRYFLENL